VIRCPFSKNVATFGLGFGFTLAWQRSVGKVEGIVGSTHRLEGIKTGYHLKKMGCFLGKEPLIVAQMLNVWDIYLHLPPFNYP